MNYTALILLIMLVGCTQEQSDTDANDPDVDPSANVYDVTCKRGDAVVYTGQSVGPAYVQETEDTHPTVSFVEADSQELVVLVNIDCTFKDTH